MEVKSGARLYAGVASSVMTTSSESGRTTAAPVVGGPRWYRRRIRRRALRSYRHQSLALYLHRRWRSPLSAVVGLIGTVISGPGLFSLGLRSPVRFLLWPC